MAWLDADFHEGDQLVYIPTSNHEIDANRMLEYIAAHPLGILLTSRDGAMFGTHLPFVIDTDAEGRTVLLGHIARANPHHRTAAEREPALVIFTGPEAYISPGWYPSKAEHGKVVPTWNYIAVHVYGELAFRHDDIFLTRQLELLTAQQEGAGPRAWKITDAPPNYLAQMKKAIVGFEFTVARMEGKWKLSQNRSRADRAGAVAGLVATGELRSVEVAGEMRRRMNVEN